MSAEWNAIEIVDVTVYGATRSLPTEQDADQFGHVIWFNPVTGAIVDKWNKDSTNYTHWRKTTLPDVVGQKFQEWVGNRYKGLLEPQHAHQLELIESAFRAGAAIR